MGEQTGNMPKISLWVIRLMNIMISDMLCVLMTFQQANGVPELYASDLELVMNTVREFLQKLGIDTAQQTQLKDELVIPVLRQGKLAFVEFHAYSNCYVVHDIVEENEALFESIIRYNFEGKKPKPVAELVV